MTATTWQPAYEEGKQVFQAILDSIAAGDSWTPKVISIPGTVVSSENVDQFMKGPPEQVMLARHASETFADGGSANARSPAGWMEIRGLTKSFAGELALAEADLDIARGEVHGLVGANGAGKSTLIRCLAGVTLADRGRITIDGEELRQGSRRPPSARVWRSSTRNSTSSPISAPCRTCCSACARSPASVSSTGSARAFGPGPRPSASACIFRWKRGSPSSRRRALAGDDRQGTDARCQLDRDGRAHRVPFRSRKREAVLNHSRSVPARTSPSSTCRIASRKSSICATGSPCCATEGSSIAPRAGAWTRRVWSARSSATTSVRPKTAGISPPTSRENPSSRCAMSPGAIP